MPKLLHDRPSPLQLMWFVDFAFPGALATPFFQHEDPLGEGTSSSPGRVVVGSGATKQRRRQTLSGRASSPISLGATRFSQCAGRNSTGRLCAHAGYARLIELVTSDGEMLMRLGWLATVGVQRP